MNRNKIALTVSSALVAGLAALTGCSHENQASTPSTAQSPSVAQQHPSVAEQYGSPMTQQPSGMTQPNEASGMGQQPPSGGALPAEPPGQAGATGATTGANSAQETMPGEQAGTQQPSTTNVDVSSLNDAQIAAVLNAVNGDQIREAQLAGSSASIPQVRQYARQVLVTHQTIQQRLDSLYTQLQIAPSPNALSNQIDADGQNRVTALHGLRGRDFDRVFMDDQVRTHNNTLELLDRAIPNAQNTRIKSQLIDMRARVDAHLRQAEVLQQEVQKGAKNHPQGLGHGRGSVNVAPGGDPALMR
jgi:putative membrane protein